MFNKVVTSVFLALNLTSAVSLAAGEPVIADCDSDPHYWSDKRWLELNVNNQSTKESLLKTTHLLGTRGLLVTHLTSLGLDESPQILVQFDSASVPKPKIPQEIKQAVFEALDSLPGNELRCVAKIGPMPAIGFSN